MLHSFCFHGSFREVECLPAAVSPWGFGGRTYDSSVSHCFNLNGGAGCVKVEEVEGIMVSYASALHNVTLAGPTLFGQVINTTAEIASRSISYNSSKYFVLLIITILDVDIGRRLESSTGRVATRDFVQFVPMREVHGEFILIFVYAISRYNVMASNYNVEYIAGGKVVSVRFRWKILRLDHTLAEGDGDSGDGDSFDSNLHILSALYESVDLKLKCCLVSNMVVLRLTVLSGPAGMTLVFRGLPITEAIMCVCVFFGLDKTQEWVKMAQSTANNACDKAADLMEEAQQGKERCAGIMQQGRTLLLLVTQRRIYNISGQLVQPMFFEVHYASFETNFVCVSAALQSHGYLNRKGRKAHTTSTAAESEAFGLLMPIQMSSMEDKKDQLKRRKNETDLRLLGVERKSEE
ncbi:hypothetical protein RHMOL_Rhmol13G0227400 [Rhododendron molle]|uniref:Uncharacterized protein n=1 Tax=Rhododendron molle TaxID=49168 RepID=A0ACC0L9K3_RHOML|nr:hypothetical protein RHMOL_Rhmol13G0227400 [Rhododendron molle]